MGGRNGVGGLGGRGEDDVVLERRLVGKMGCGHYGRPIAIE